MRHWRAALLGGIEILLLYYDVRVQNRRYLVVFASVGSLFIVGVDVLYFIPCVCAIAGLYVDDGRVRPPVVRGVDLPDVYDAVRVQLC